MHARQAYTGSPSQERRVLTVGGVVVLHLLVALLLLRPAAPPAIVDRPALQAFDLPLPPPEQVPAPPPPAVELGGSPAALRPLPTFATPAQTAAAPATPPLPTVVVVEAPRPPAIPAPVAGIAAATGGTGSGGGGGSAGAGTGNGNGAGTGNGEGLARPARWIAGTLGVQPCPITEGHCPSVTIGVRYRIDVTGRLRDCRITKPSNRYWLDSITCGRLERRMLYAPARDAQGVLIPYVFRTTARWDPAER